MSQAELLCRVPRTPVVKKCHNLHVSIRGDLDVAECFKVLLVRENKRKPKDPRFASPAWAILKKCNQNLMYLFPFNSYIDLMNASGHTVGDNLFLVARPTFWPRQPLDGIRGLAPTGRASI